MARRLAHKSVNKKEKPEIGIKTSSRNCALLDLLEGKTDYKIFKDAACFGWIAPDDFVCCTGAELAKTKPWKNHKGGINKDHALSRAPVHQSIMAGDLTYNDFKANIRFALVSYYTRAIDPELPYRLLGEAADLGLALFWSAVLLGHPANCHVVEFTYNGRKGSSNSIEFPELVKRVIDWEKLKPLQDIRPLNARSSDQAHMKNVCKQERQPG